MSTASFISIAIAIFIVGGIAFFAQDWVRAAKGGTKEHDTPNKLRK